MNMFIIIIYEIDVALFSFNEKQYCLQLWLMLNVYIYMMGFFKILNAP